MALLWLTASAAAQHFVTPIGPGPTDAAEIMAFDPLREVSVAFVDGQTWEHNGYSWRQVATTNVPPDRYEFALGFDGQHIVIYGGQAVQGGALADFWAFDGVDWTLIGNHQPPGRRRAAAVAYDPSRARLVLYGGTDMSNGFPADTWEWDGATWMQVANGTPNPNSRVWHRMVFDDSRQRVVLCAGAFNPMTYMDTWEWDGSAWLQTVVSSFPPTIAPSLVHDQSTGRTLMISGWNGGAGYARNEVHAYDPANGTWTLVLGNTPLMEQFVGAAYDPNLGRTVVLTGDPLWGSARTYWYRDSGSVGASYAPFGIGCPLGNGHQPQLAAASGSRPALGTSYTVHVSTGGGAVAVALAVGLSRTYWNGAALPASLTPYGLTGCALLVAPQVLVAMTVGGTGSAASLTRTMPNSAVLRGLVFHEQALLLDPTASNGFGAVSNGAIAVVH
jgi:hypothetical protein